MTRHLRVSPVGSGPAPERGRLRGVADDGRSGWWPPGCPARPRSGCVAPPGAALVPATLLADPAWTAQVLDARAPRGRAVDRRVLATVWWYSASSVLVTPAAGRAGRRHPALGAAGRPDRGPAAGRGADRGAGRRRVPRTRPADLRASLAAVVAAVAEAGGMRERPLWAIATDSLANRLLDLGRAAGDPAAATGAGAHPGRGDRRPRCRCRGTRTSAAPGSPAGRRAACSTSCRRVDVHVLPPPSAGGAARPAGARRARW